jgi:hypothetical protein
MRPGFPAATFASSASPAAHTATFFSSASLAATFFSSASLAETPRWLLIAGPVRVPS